MNAPYRCGEGYVVHLPNFPSAERFPYIRGFAGETWGEIEVLGNGWWKN